jgi:aldose 1-epimerase
VSLASFGRLADGREVAAVTLSGGGLEVELIAYGAIVRRLTITAGGAPVSPVLGFDSLADYEADRAYQGCIVGRCANRIGGAAFEIDGVRHEVEANEGRNCLHGGLLGFGKRLWTFEAVEPARATLRYVSPAGEAGFPGEVRCRVRVEAGEDGLAFDYTAETDAPTPVNLTHHLYFNLSGDPTTPVLDHDLTIAGDAVTEVDAELIPTGRLLPVAGTPFDFRTPRRIGDALDEDHPQLALGGGIDHNWALGAGPVAAALACRRTGLSLAIETDQPGLQVYGGQGLTTPFAAHGGLVFEPQGFPDAVNRPHFPGVVLRPGAIYRRRAVYRFAFGA